MCSLWVYMHIQCKLAIHTLSTNQRKQATVAICMILTTYVISATAKQSITGVLPHERGILIMWCIVNWFTIPMFTVCIQLSGVSVDAWPCWGKRWLYDACWRLWGCYSTSSKSARTNNWDADILIRTFIVVVAHRWHSCWQLAWKGLVLTGWSFLICDLWWIVTLRGCGLAWRFTLLEN